MSIVHIEASRPYDVLIDECTLDEVDVYKRQQSDGVTKVVSQKLDQARSSARA